MSLEILVGNTMSKRSKLAQSTFLFFVFFVLQQKKIELVNTVVYYVRHGNSQVKNTEETHLFPMFK